MLELLDEVRNQHLLDFVLPQVDNRLRHELSGFDLRQPRHEQAKVEGREQLSELSKVFKLPVYLKILRNDE